MKPKPHDLEHNYKELYSKLKKQPCYEDRSPFRPFSHLDRSVI